MRDRLQSFLGQLIEQTGVCSQRIRVSYVKSPGSENEHGDLFVSRIVSQPPQDIQGRLPRKLEIQEYNEYDGRPAQCLNSCAAIHKFYSALRRRSG